MSDLAKRIFYLLPSLGKDIAVSLYGMKRSAWRYNKESDRLIEDAAQRESWSFARWKAYQDEQLELLLHRAYHHVPYYRDYWSKRRQSGDRSSYTDLKNWPIINKQVVRANTLAFLAADCNPAKMYHEHTGGTSGSPLNVYWSKITTLKYYAIFERRIRNWHGVTRHTRYGILGGQMLVPFSQKKPPFWVRNFGMNQLYMSSYHISKDTVKAYLDAMTSFGVEYLFGYASSLYSIAHLGRMLNLQFPTLKVAISNAEPLFEYQKETISAAFGCEVVNTYGMSELVAAGCTSVSSNGKIELWPEVGIIEENTADDRRFICTGILNQDMALIRYDLGDNGVLEYPGSGRLDFFNIQELLGRNDDLVITRDGRRIGRLDTVFKKDLGIVEAQIVQEDFDKFIINVVPDGNFNEGTKWALVESLKERVGDVDVNVELVNKVPRTSMGKFRAVISKVSE
jgi:phenylacetate-CoA ligase